MNVPLITTLPVVVIVFVPLAVKVPLDVKFAHVIAPVDVVSVAVFETSPVTVQLRLPSPKLPPLTFNAPAIVNAFVSMLMLPPVTVRL